jgi:hypothetical protein
VYILSNYINLYLFFSCVEDKFMLYCFFMEGRIRKQIGESAAPMVFNLSSTGVQRETRGHAASSPKPKAVETISPSASPIPENKGQSLDAEHVALYGASIAAVVMLAATGLIVDRMRKRYGGQQ